ncbi:hypothetical protein ACFSUK_12115 [Sphingobium scionense]
MKGAASNVAPAPHTTENTRILIVSRHDYRTARRASVHFVARQMAQQGHDVAFLSIGYSWLSRLRGDSRSALFHRANNWEVIDGLRAYLWRSAWHPVKLPVPTGVDPGSTAAGRTMPAPRWTMPPAMQRSSSSNPALRQR